MMTLNPDKMDVVERNALVSNMKQLIVALRNDAAYSNGAYRSKRMRQADLCDASLVSLGEVTATNHWEHDHDTQLELSFV